MKKALIKFYLDWTNNWLTVKEMSAHYNLTEDDCNTLIDLGRKYLHQSYTLNY